MTATLLATARVKRKTLVESSTAMMMINTGIEVPNKVSNIMAKINCGMAIMTSTTRESS
ncbi:hypothetical protein D3C77_804290 [compost metagenome]